MAEKTVGIDLGTTFSAIAHINRFNVPEIIPNSEGETITPSVILFDEDRTLVGKLARQGAAGLPERVVEFVKREMGKPINEYSREFDGRVYSAEQLSSIILKKLKNDAEHYLGSNVSNAVITVPAYFNEFQRAATIESGKIAGLNVLRIINEPTAAALAFGVHKANSEQKVIVYDLGGGTFDVTIMDIRGKNIELIATNGNSTLGGKDWDDEIIKYVARAFEEEYGIDPLEDSFAFQDLQMKSVQAKIILSSRMQTPIVFGYKGQQIKVELTRENFYELTSRYLEQCRTLLDVVLDEAQLRCSQIDTILLTGGSTRMPMVREMLRSYFGKEPNSSINPDEVVALGAAVQGAMLEVAKGIAPANVVKMLGGIKSVDVNPHSLGTVVFRDDQLHNSIIIPKNMPIPTERSRDDYVTSFDNQTSLDIFLLQGEDANPRYCLLLGAYEFSGIPPRPAGKSRIRIAFKYDLNGMVEVEAKDIENNKQLVKSIKKEDVNLDLLEASRPIDVGLLIDASGSMGGDKIEDAKNAVIDFLNELQGSFRVGLISFGDPLAHIRTPLTNDYQEVRRQVKGLSANNGTPMAEAISLAGSGLFERDNVENVIILLTDGQPNDSAQTERVAEHAKSKGIRIVTIGVGSDVDRGLLTRIASTPQDYHPVSESIQLSSTFINLATELSRGKIGRL